MHSFLDLHVVSFGGKASSNYFSVPFTFGAWSVPLFDIFTVGAFDWNLSKLDSKIIFNS